MTGRLGDAALALCGVAARALGWRPAEFWTATPAELATALGMDSPEPAAFERALLDRMMETDLGR